VARFSKIATNVETALLELADKAVAAVLDCGVPTRSIRHDEAASREFQAQLFRHQQSPAHVRLGSADQPGDGLERSVKCFFTDVKSGKAR